MNTARNGSFLSGDNTNAICSGGSVEPGVQTKAELWNGSAWTETGDINTARYNGGAWWNLYRSIDFWWFKPSEEQ